MPSLLVVVFILQLAIHLINTIGAPVIDDLLWRLYNILPISTSEDAQPQVELRQELIKLKRELNATSSQDQFATWAKLRRQHDKKQTEYDQKSEHLSHARSRKVKEQYDQVSLQDLKLIYAFFLANGLKSFKSTFDRSVQVLRFLSTNGLRFFLQFWYAKQPMFWIPMGWVPWYIEWLLSFPRAPTGSVSIQIWGIACITVVQMVGAAIVATVVLESQGPQRAKKGEPMQMGAAGTGGKSGKKEL